MSIPGLGSFGSAAAPSADPASASVSTTSTVSLRPFWEYRFEVPLASSITIRLASGNAEKDGTELAPNNPYVFSGTKSKINTWHGCELEVSATAQDAHDAYVSELTADETPLVSYLNLHMKLEGLRSAAAGAKGAGAMGPRVLVVGPSNTGKTSLVKMLTAWATRMGGQPLVVNTDTTQGMLSLPGTLSAAVFPTIMDITTEWGGTPSSGPAAIPVKLPLTYYYGLEQPEDDPKLYRTQLGRLAAAATSRLAEDPDVRTSGMLVDTVAVSASKPDYDILAHIVAEFSINIIVSLGSERVSAELARRFLSQRTSLGEAVAVLGLEKSGGVAERDGTFMRGVREKAIREYFFGAGKRTLNPGTQNVGFDDVGVWRVVAETNANPDNDDDYYDPAPAEQPLEKAEPSVMMLNCTLAVMYASIHDSPETIRDANVMGFVYVTDVDEKRKRLKILAPVNARLGDRPLLWGNWPEPMVSLLG